MIKYVGKCLVIEEGEEKSLVIGDLHFGYGGDASWTNKRMLENMVEEMETIFRRIEGLSDAGRKGKGKKEKKERIDKIILLGDVKHGFLRGSPREWKEILWLFKYLKEKCGEVIVIKGNHDNYLKNIANQGRVKVYDFYKWKNFCFLHGDMKIKEAEDREVGCWVIGHLHPAIVLRKGAKQEKYKCFLSGRYRNKRMIIVPSFFHLVEGKDVLKGDLNLPWKFDIRKFNVCVVGENGEVLDFGKLNELYF